MIKAEIMENCLKNQAACAIHEKLLNALFNLYNETCRDLQYDGERYTNFENDKDFQQSIATDARYHEIVKTIIPSYVEAIDNLFD